MDKTKDGGSIIIREETREGLVIRKSLEELLEEISEKLDSVIELLEELPDELKKVI